MRSDRLAEPAGLHLDIRPKLRIGLLWHSARSGNLGVGALTLSNMAIARAVAEELGYAPELTLLSMRDHETDPIVPPEVRIRTIDARRFSHQQPIGGGLANWIAFSTLVPVTVSRKSTGPNALDFFYLARCW